MYTTLMQVEDRNEVERNIEVTFYTEYTNEHEGNCMFIEQIYDKDLNTTLDELKDFDRLGREMIYYHCEQSLASQEYGMTDFITSQL